MKSVRRLVLAASMLALAGAAHAQVPAYGAPPWQLPTFHASISFTPAVTASKDVLTIAGSSKIVRVTRFACSGLSTAAASTPVTLNKYLTALSAGGTATTVVAQKSDSNDSAAATAVVKAYTAVPTTNGTGGGAIRNSILQTNVSTGIGTEPLVWTFSERSPERPGIVLRGALQSLALTTSATALAAGTVLNCEVEWTEQ